MAYDLHPYDNYLENSKLSKLGDIYFTVVEEETYTYSNDITEKPVEDGSIITDHIKSKLIVIKLTGLLTGKTAYPQEELTALRTYCLNGDILKYVGIQSFSNVVIESFDNKHTYEVTNGIQFSISLKEVRIVNKTEINVNTASLNIPDIEALKDQLSAQKSANRAAARARVKGTTTKGRQGKKAAKGKETILEKIQSRY